MAKDNQQDRNRRYGNKQYIKSVINPIHFFTTPAYLEAYGTLVGLKPPTAKQHVYLN